MPILFILYGEKILPNLIYLHRLSSSKTFGSTCSIKDYSPELVGENIDIHQKRGNYKIPAFWIPAKNNKNSNIIVYSHGSGFDRCKKTRIDNYKTLNKLGYSVLAFDYGGFSNSSKTTDPTADSLIFDLETVTEYVEILKNSKNSDQKIILWGHSLGSVVSTRAIRETQVGRLLDALVLEAAHADLLRTVVIDHPWPEVIRKVYGRWMVAKGVDYFKTRLKMNRFNTKINVEQVAKLSLPTIILHAEDDPEVPISHAIEIFSTLKNKIPELYFLKSKADEKLGHYCLDKMADRWSVILEQILES